MDSKTINKIKQLTEEQKKTIKIIYNDSTQKYQIYVLDQKKVKL